MDFKKIILLSGVGLVSAAVGIVIPRVMSGGSTAAASAEGEAGHDAHDGHETAKSDEKKHEAAPKADSHGKVDSGGHGKTDGAKVVRGNGPVFVPFGQIVVNLNEPTLTKYLSLDITLQTDPKSEEELATALQTQKPILSTWLTSHLADKTMEDIRGKVGVNRLRREIQDNFNSLLFKDGRERIVDILFEEYHVQ
jgi:flagellar FliL protein